MKKYLLLPAILILALNSFSQNYSRVDSITRSLGSLDSFNVATIADTISRKFATKEEKARALFYWIATNIQHDLKAVRSNDNRKSDPVSVIQFRKATAQGYANLLQEMYSMANIRCLTVDGYTRSTTEDINNPADDFNHTWNVVQLGQSPEEWYYVDAFKAAGFSDSRFTTFTPAFEPGYFFTARYLFNLDHFPDNQAWQLGPGPKTKKDFYTLPVIGRYAYTLGMTNMTPSIGYNKTRITKPATYTISYSNNIPIEKVELVTGDERRPDKPIPMNFTPNGQSFSFTYTFKKDDEYPVRMMVNDKVLLGYMYEVVE